jgi:hypothetical protein
MNYTTPKTEVMSKRVSDAPATGLGKAGGEHMAKIRGSLSKPLGPLLSPPKSLKRRK